MANESSQMLFDERRARQMLEEQIKIISAVCKKLNTDVEVRQFNK
jgi:hypothetical protein